MSNIPLFPMDPADTVGTQPSTVHGDNWPREARLTHSLPFLVRAVSQTWHTADELGDKMVRNDRGQHHNDLLRGITFSKQTKIASISSSKSCKKYWSKCKVSNLLFFLLRSIYTTKIMLEITPKAGAWFDKVSSNKMPVFLYLALLCYRTYGI